jgi:hypothetical protein
MKKVLVLTLIVLFAFASLAFAVPASLKTSLIPAEAQWVIQFDVQKFVASTLGQLLDKEPKFNKDDFTVTLKDKLGIDPRKDMEAVTIYGYGGEGNTVVYWSGNFNPKRIISYIKKENKKNKKKLIESSYGKHKLYGMEKGICLSFLKDGLAVVAMSNDAMTNAIDVFQGKKKSLSSSALLDYLKAAPSGAFLKAAVHDIASLAGKQHAPAMLKKATGAYFTASEKSGLFQLMLSVSTDSPDTANNMYQLVMGFMALAKLQKDVPAHLQKPMDLLNSLKIEVKGNAIQAAFSHPSNELANILMTLASHDKKHVKK